MKKSIYMPRVVDAEYLRNHKIRIEFSNGVIKDIDFEKYIGGGIFEPLKNKAYFKKFFVDGWTISWPNGVDIAPETLYGYRDGEK